MEHDPRDDPHGDSSPPPLVGLSIILYGLMSVIAIVIMSAADIDPVARIFGAQEPTATSPTPLALHGLIGVGAGLAVVALSWLVRDFKPMRSLRDQLAGLIGPQTSTAIAILSITSSVGEELFFRGALQPLIGLWPTAVIFGVLHGGHSKKLFAWAIFGVLAGFLLGWLADLTGNLLAPILAHLTVNYWNLHALVRAAPSEGDITP